MSEDILNEQVSALADDELGREERKLLLRRMQESTALRERWARYCLIRDTLRDSLPARIDAGFAVSIAERVAGDPYGQSVARFAPAMRRITGIAVAASVAAVALFTLRVDEPAVEPMPEAATVVPVTGTPQVPVVRFAASAGPSWDSARPEVQIQLNQFLLTHSDAADISPAVDVVVDEAAGDDDR